jgi:UDP-N-acetylmuramoyl-tripeptide--D-alanyl-D-alanine ligase
VSGVVLGWSLEEAADAMAGRLVGSGTQLIREVTTDSRGVVDENLFVALAGDSFDGHEFVASALEHGAIGAVVEMDAGSDVTPRIEVASTLDALGMLAVKRRDELSIPVVAITGSTGKTSTKDLLAAGIEGSWSSPRSFNNEIGVPLTVLGTPLDATALILEVGSRGRGHIGMLAPMVRPDIAVITNLGVVHLETFGTQQDLADAKFELVEALPKDGVAVLPFGEKALEREGRFRLVTFGGQGADVQVSGVSIDELGLPSFDLRTAHWGGRTSLPLAGQHQALNAAAAVAVATALDLDVDRFISRLSTASASAWRMDVHTGVFTVVNDAYNANPQSLESALRTVAAMGGRQVAVLGLMSELGQVCEQEHVRLGQLAQSLGFSELLIVGPDHGYAVGFGKSARKATGFEDAVDTLADIVEPGDIVLVKASRSASLELLALHLIEDAGS